MALGGQETLWAGDIELHCNFESHIHLLVADDGDRMSIPRSIQLVAGRTGQEYNQRKDRKGAFWQDRYHATAVETGRHFLQCLVYIDLNMVRAGVIAHPIEWNFSGYREIQKPRRKCALIAYERLHAALQYGRQRHAKRGEKVAR